MATRKCASDTIPPVITLTSPSDNAAFTGLWGNFIARITDNKDATINCNYTITTSANLFVDNSGGLISFVNNTLSTKSLNNDVDPTKIDLKFIFECRDAAGNKATVTRTGIDVNPTCFAPTCEAKDTTTNDSCVDVDTVKTTFFNFSCSYDNCNTPQTVPGTIDCPVGKRCELLPTVGCKTCGLRNIIPSSTVSGLCCLGFASITESGQTLCCPDPAVTGVAIKLEYNSLLSRWECAEHESCYVPTAPDDLVYCRYLFSSQFPQFAGSERCLSTPPPSPSIACCPVVISGIDTYDRLSVVVYS